MRSLIEKLKSQSDGCEEKCIDLRNLKFEAKEGEVRFIDGVWSYYFKSDPKKPNDPKVVWAAKQFCKLAGIPFSFFHKNPEYMKSSMVDCWIPTLKPEKSTIMTKLRRTADCDKFVFRALLPVEFTNVTNVDVMEAVSTAIGDDYNKDFVIGDERDDLILHVRLISKETFEVCGEKCSVGFSVVCSELGASNLTVDTMLFRDASKTCLVASYPGPYFDYEYEKIQAKDLLELFPNLMSRLRGQLTELKLKVQSAKEETESKADIQTILKDLRLRKGLNEKFHTLLFQEIGSGSDVRTLWDLSNKVALVAKNFDVVNRVRCERVAGELVRLVFAKP
jgi:hypothetical protein